MKSEPVSWISVRKHHICEITSMESFKNILRRVREERHSHGSKVNKSTCHQFSRNSTKDNILTYIEPYLSVDTGNSTCSFYKLSHKSHFCSIQKYIPPQKECMTFIDLKNSENFFLDVK